MAKKPFNYVPNFCKCGGEPVMAQWLDTLKPNSTWIQCKCGLMTRCFYHKDPLVAKQKAIKMWNTKAKTRRKLKNGFRSCEKCGSDNVVYEEKEFTSFTSIMVYCEDCHLMTDDMDEEGNIYTKEDLIRIWNL